MSEAKFHIVEFHADGGQCCIGGRRSFTDKERADAFANGERSRKGHTCGPESVRQSESDTDLGDDGIIYTDDGRNLPTVDPRGLYGRGRERVIMARMSSSVSRERVSYGSPPLIAWIVFFAIVLLISYLVIVAR